MPAADPVHHPVLVDTGPIVAMLNDADTHHEACIEQLRHITGPLRTCWPVVTEAAWLLRAYPKAITALLSASGGDPLELAPLSGADLPGISAILSRYRSLGIQLADASLVHLANRDGIDTIFTLDRRDFSVLRKSARQKLRLIP